MIPTSIAQPAQSQDIADLFRRGRPNELRAFMESCPDFPLRAQAEQLVAMDVPAARSIALSMAGQGLAFGRSAALGAEVSLAAHTLLREDFKRYGAGVVLPLTLSRAASEALSALNLAGRSTEALAFADEVMPLYDDEPENGPTIRVARITALYQLKRVDEAKAAIAKERTRGVSVPARIELDRLDNIVTQMTSRVTERRGDRPATQASEALSEDNRRARSVMDKLTTVLSGSGDEMNEWRAMKLIRDGTSIFTDPKIGRDPARIRDSLAQLIKARNWARDNESAAHENDALWGLYLCYSRLSSPPEATVVLQSLRANLEQARASVANPIERGGITSRYPHLFPALCKMLTQIDKPLDLLDAIEGAKGRAVADLLVKRSGSGMSDRLLVEPAAQLPSLMKRVGAHYVSFLVDQDETYAVLVAKDGSVHQADPIPLGLGAIRAAAERVDPQTWEQNPADEALAPLVAWLAPYRRSGLLQDGDHICYSPDDQLSNVPLHFLPIDGGSLAEAFSVSRTHGAATLAILLNGTSPRLTRYFVIEVPKREDPSDERFLKALAYPRTLLRTFVPQGNELLGPNARPDALKGIDLTHRIVHFATHGEFAPLNPYTSSGLLLAGPNGLPDGTEEGTLLTPQRILDMNLNFTESHVSLQACVSGLAEEGLGGDALGLDWALMQAGARSLLASHWEIALGLSAKYFDIFYRYWLKDGLSRAQAWRSTIRDLRAAGGDFGDPYCWAAFSLSGDWR